jgi:hypothetical protein
MDFGGDNTAAVTQLGSSHFAEVRQSGGFATTVANIFELGTAHVARIAHGGFNGIHHATIHLEGDGNEATITQGYIEAAFNNAHVLAVGSANDAAIVQSAENSTSATIHQEGGSNTARTEQLYSSIAISHISQHGDLNAAIVLQSGALGRGENASTVTQSGVGNVAELRQFTIDVFTQRDNHSALSQNGDFNKVTIVQQGASNNSAVSVVGSDNTVSVRQQ